MKIQADTLESKDNTSGEECVSWELFLSRPFSIFGMSLWNYWYHSKVITDLTGGCITKGVFLGTPVTTGNTTHEFLVRCFRDTTELSYMRDYFSNLLEYTPEKALALLEHGQYIFETELLRAESPDPSVLFAELQSPEAVLERCAVVGIYTALIPYLFIGRCSAEDIQLRTRIEELATSLRAKTLYPLYIQKVVVPYFAQYTGISTEEVHRYTYKELLSLKAAGNVSAEILSDRKQRISAYSIVYTTKENTETLEFVEHSAVLQRQNNLETGKSTLDHLEVNNAEQGTGLKKEGREIVLKGVVVSKGDGKPVRGIARVVTGTDISGIEFNEGDILVTIHGSPVYLPLIQKAGALLSEEGGIACHTAVVARGLTIMGLNGLINLIDNGTLIELIVDKDNLYRIICTHQS